MGQPDPCLTQLRDADRDRYLSLLYAPPDKRSALAALYVFDAELSCLRDKVSGPLPGEIRLQWWRDVFHDDRRGEAMGHPLAKSLCAAIERYRLPRQAFLAYLDTRLFDLYDDPFATVTDLEVYCGQTSSAIIRLATLILADGGDAEPASAAGYAGVSLGVIAMLRAMQRPSPRRPMCIPLEILTRHGLDRDRFLSGEPADAVQAAWRSMIDLSRRCLADADDVMLHLPSCVMPAFLTLALAGRWLHKLDRAGFHPSQSPADLSPLHRQWILWREARRIARYPTLTV